MGFGNISRASSRIAHTSLFTQLERAVRIRPGIGAPPAGPAGIIRPKGLAEQIGLVFKTIPGGPFIYQGKKEENIESFEAQETPFTIGMMNELVKLKRAEVSAFFKDPEGEKSPEALINEMFNKSYDSIAKDVPETEWNNCPLVWVSQHESQMIASLLEASLLTDLQWERAASWTKGWRRPWGRDIDHTKAVYDDIGTRPVKSKPAGMSKEGLYDLIGLVWEWTQSSLRGGAYDCLSSFEFLQADFGGFELVNKDRSRNVGFRLARRIGAPKIAAPIPAAPIQWQPPA